MVILFDKGNLPSDIYEIIFATEQQKLVARLLIEDMKRNGGELNKTQMSVFATQLHEGITIELPEGPFQRIKKVQISYNKRQYYDRILTPMKGMGLIDYDIYKKTYKIDDDFNKMMIKLGLMWLREIR